MFRKYFSNLHVQSNESKKGSNLHFIKKNKLITHSAFASKATERQIHNSSLFMYCAVKIKKNVNICHDFFFQNGID